MNFFITILIIILIILFISYLYFYPIINITYYYNKNINNFTTNIIYNNITPIKIEIPLNIFQHWHNSELPPDMKKTVDIIRNTNPEFNHTIYDNITAREFIKTNFDNEVLNAFDCLKPLAYKCDLFRYCVLYIKGGIYLDIKYEPKNGFKLINLVDKEHFALDPPFSWSYKTRAYGIFNGIFVCKQNNNILKKTIDIIVLNVKNKNYGISALSPTGPLLVGKSYMSYYNYNMSPNSLLSIDLFLRNTNTLQIIYKKTLIFEMYDTYRKEQASSNTNEYYAELWKKRDIYLC